MATVLSKMRNLYKHGFKRYVSDNPGSPNKFIPKDYADYRNCTKQEYNIMKWLEDGNQRSTNSEKTV